MKTFLTRLGQARPAISLLQPRLLSLQSPRHSSTTTSPSSDPAATPSTASTPSQTITAHPQQPPTAQSRPYLVGLTPSNQFPVYAQTKAAGQSKFTLIKKIEGNKRVFVQDLAKETGLDAGNIVINPVTGHVQIKGFHVLAVKSWLAGLFGDPKKLKALDEDTA